MEQRHARRFYNGTSAERGGLGLPADAIGITFWDTDLTQYLVWSGSAWRALGGHGVGWPFPTATLTVDSTAGDADYNDIGTAIAAATGDESVWFSPESYGEAGGVSLPDGAGLIGINRDDSIIATTAAATCVILEGDGYGREFSATNIQNAAGGIFGMRRTGGAGDFNLNNVYVLADNTGAGDAWGYSIESGTNYLIQPHIVATQNGGTATALYAETATVYILTGILDGEDYDVGFGAGADIVIIGSMLASGTFNGALGTYRGYWWDDTGRNLIIQDFSALCNLGVNTDTPGTDIGGGTWDVTGAVIECYAQLGDAAYVISSGNTGWLVLADATSGANDKLWAMLNDSGSLYCRALNDDGTTRIDNILVMDLGDGNVGSGTATPGLNLAGGASDLTGKALHLKDTTNEATFLAEGNTGARIYLVDLGGAANRKVLELDMDAGAGIFRSLNDDLTLLADNALVIGLAAGHIGINVAPADYRFRVYHQLDSTPFSTEIMCYMQQDMPACTIAVGGNVPAWTFYYQLDDAATVWNANVTLLHASTRYLLYNQLSGTGGIKALAGFDWGIAAYATSSGTYTAAYGFRSLGSYYRHAASTAAYTTLMHYSAYGAGGLGVTTQYGFHVSAMTGATTSHGYYVENCNGYSIWVDAGVTRLDDPIAAPGTAVAGAVTNRYGGGTNFCGDPDIWLRININGTDYKFPGYS